MKFVFLTNKAWIRSKFVELLGGVSLRRKTSFDVLFYRQGTMSCHNFTKIQFYHVQAGSMLELVHCGRGTTVGDFDRCAVSECNSLYCGCHVFCVICCYHPSCRSDWCMGSLCVPLSYLSENSAVHCGACLHHHACGCPPSEAIGCERDGDLCLKGGEARPGEGGAGVSNQSSFINALYLGHNRDVIGHPEQHQPNLGLVLCCLC